jgi:hypothetical protein
MQNRECHTNILSPIPLYHYALKLFISPLAALHNPFLTEYSSCSVFLSSTFSLSLSLSTPPYHPLSLPHYQFLYIYFLSPNQFPYKFKERSTETNFVSHFSVTSLTLCSQAAIFNQPQYWHHYVCKDKMVKED